MDLLSVDQLSEFLGVNPSTVYGLTRQRSNRSDAPPLPFIRLGKSLKFRRSSVEAWLIAKEEVSR